MRALLPGAVMPVFSGSSLLVGSSRWRVVDVALVEVRL
jgi:hypothetical protein